MSLIEAISRSGLPEAAALISSLIFDLLPSLMAAGAVALLSRRLLGSRPGAGTVMGRIAGVMMLVVGLGILGEKAAELVG